MNTIDIIKDLCKSKGTSLKALEKELGYSNGSLSKAKVIPSDRILELSKYFHVSMEYLMTGKEELKESDPELTARDERDIAKDLYNIMSKIRSGDDGPLRYNGEVIDDESLALLESAIGTS